MKPWFSAIICTAIFSVLFFAVAGYFYVDYRHKEQRSHEWTIYLLSCKTDDLNVESFPIHYRSHYEDYSDDYLNKLKGELSLILESNPDAKLFHYNTPEKIWRQLGGRKGYAILIDSKIVWERRLAQS